jgi:hypothetical protein
MGKTEAWVYHKHGLRTRKIRLWEQGPMRDQTSSWVQNDKMKRMELQDWCSALTRTAIVRLEFIFFEYELIVYILYIWQIEIRFRD